MRTTRIIALAVVVVIGLAALLAVRIAIAAPAVAEPQVPIQSVTVTDNTYPIHLTVVYQNPTGCVPATISLPARTRTFKVKITITRAPGCSNTPGFRLISQNYSISGPGPGRYTIIVNNWKIVALAIP